MWHEWFAVIQATSTPHGRKVESTKRTREAVLFISTPHVSSTPYIFRTRARYAANSNLASATVRPTYSLPNPPVRTPTKNMHIHVEERTVDVQGHRLDHLDNRRHQNGIGTTGRRMHTCNTRETETQIPLTPLITAFNSSNCTSHQQRQKTHK